MDATAERTETPKPVTRQRQWQLDKNAAGLCGQCGRREGVPLCPVCQAKVRVRMREATGCKSRAVTGVGRPWKKA